MPSKSRKSAVPPDIQRKVDNGELIPHTEAVRLVAEALTKKTREVSAILGVTTTQAIRLLQNDEPGPSEAQLRDLTIKVANLDAAELNRLAEITPQDSHLAYFVDVNAPNKAKAAQQERSTPAPTPVSAPAHAPEYMYLLSDMNIRAFIYAAQLEVIRHKLQHSVRRAPTDNTLQAALFELAAIEVKANLEYGQVHVAQQILKEVDAAMKGEPEPRPDYFHFAA